MDDLEFYTTESGAPAARGKDQRLATYLETDVQGSIDIAEQLVTWLKDTAFRGELSGNGHCITITSQLVTIESLFDEEMPARRLSRAAFLATIKRWLTFIR